MNRYISEGIILSRTNFGEADRIISFITPTHGKVSAIAKGVRKQKSKLAGGIELFSISSLTILPGRSQISTLMSTRLLTNFANISKDMARSDAGYEMIRLTNRCTEEEPEEAYYNLLKQGFEALNDLAKQPKPILLWFQLQFLKQAGHSPDLQEDTAGQLLGTQSRNLGTISLYLTVISCLLAFGIG